MPEADDWPRASEVDARLKWPSADAGDGGGSDETGPTTRGFFLGQLPEDEPNDVWADEAPDGAWADEQESIWADDPPDGGEGDGADVEGVLQDGEEDLDPLAMSFETELHDAVPTDGDATELSLASVADEPTRVGAGAMPAVGARKAFR
ncbi:MAG TPA: hypothetical protein VHY55_09565, partial [Acidimicrobiia bacterium]|nr:hypothetical protein [Acidimicrobiia bacterium]